jgi:hypothetical protein
MTPTEEMLYAPLTKKLYDITYRGGWSSYSKGALPLKEVLELLEHLTNTYGEGYAIVESPPKS